MNPENEALALLDRSLERLQQNIERMKNDQNLLLMKNQKHREKILSLEEKKEYALKELYTMRDMIAKELHWTLDKNQKKTSSPPLIFMSDEDPNDSHE